MPPEFESPSNGALSTQESSVPMSRREFHADKRNTRTRHIPASPAPQASVLAEQPTDLTDASAFTSRRSYRAAQAGAHRRPSDHHRTARVAPSLAAAAVVVVTGGVVASAHMSPAVPEANIAATNAALVDLSSREVSSASRSQSRGAVASLSTDLSSASHAQMDLAVKADANTAAISAATTEQTTAAMDEIRRAQTFVAPVAQNGRITSEFGQRWGRAHNGIDYGAPEGTDLVSVGKGEVIVADYNSGLGNHVKILLDDGTLIVYGHLVSSTVSAGDQVMPGDLVGYLGNTGNSTGPHLHLEVRPGGNADSDPVNPRPWLEERNALL